MHINARTANRPSSILCQHVQQKSQCAWTGPSMKEPGISAVSGTFVIFPYTLQADKRTFIHERLKKLLYLRIPWRRARHRRQESEEVIRNFAPLELRSSEWIYELYGWWRHIVIRE